MCCPCSLLLLLPLLPLLRERREHQSFLNVPLFFFLAFSLISFFFFHGLFYFSSRKKERCSDRLTDGERIFIYIYTLFLFLLTPFLSSYPQNSFYRDFSFALLFFYSYLALLHVFRFLFIEPRHGYSTVWLYTI